jgi:hypothetical protein
LIEILIKKGFIPFKFTDPIIDVLEFLWNSIKVSKYLLKSVNSRINLGFISLGSFENLNGFQIFHF